jgi:hypothetical protein
LDFFTATTDYAHITERKNDDPQKTPNGAKQISGFRLEVKVRIFSVLLRV